MLFLLIDNTNDIECAKMTPLLIQYFQKKNIDLKICKNTEQLPNLIYIKGIILSGGPMLLSNETYLKDYIINFNILINYPKIPVLGICFGFQIISMAYGGSINKLIEPKINLKEDIYIYPKSSILYRHLKNKKNTNVYQYHNDFIETTPSNFNITGYDKKKIIQSIENTTLRRFGTQFHPENSEDGYKILDNFIEFCLEVTA
jgi:anthranilate/para-aminobenzoate synthase component II